MAVRGIAFLLTGLLLGGCMQGTLEQASDANFSPRDRKLLANAPYARAMKRICWEESMHILHGRDVLLTMMSGSTRQQAICSG